MSSVKEVIDTSTGITCTLASLATGAARESASVDNTSNLYLDAIFSLKVKVQSGTPGSDKTVYIYCAGSEDGTNFTDNATGSDAALTMASPTNLKLIGTIAIPTASASYWSGPLSIARAFGGVLPRKWSIIVYNLTNLTFSATEGDHSKTYSGIYQTVA